MSNKKLPVEQFVKEQLKKWKRMHNTKITDPNNYDLTINMGNMEIETAVGAVVGAAMAARDVTT